MTSLALLPTAADPARAAGLRRQRSDGAEARAHLLKTALRLFSDKGFSKTSIREIARAADANVAAIRYYFGDKAGLYRAVFTEPLGSAGDDIALYNQPHLSLRESLEGFFSSFLAPLKQGELMELCTRLHLREMLEPTALWAEEVDNGIKPAHAALVAILSRHLNLSRTDDDVHRLAFSITGLALHMFIGRDIVKAIRPQLLGKLPAVDLWASRVVGYAEAMAEAEVRRRHSGAEAAKKPPVRKIES